MLLLKDHFLRTICYRLFYHYASGTLFAIFCLNLALIQRKSLNLEKVRGNIYGGIDNYAACHC